MIRRITTRKSIAVASVLALGVVMTVLALAFTNRTGPNLPDPIPPMTLTYEVYGPGVSVGDRTSTPYKELVRLEYRSQTDWTETIIESPTLDLGRYGEGTSKGSWRQLKGNVYTEYDAMDGGTYTSSEGGGVLLPHSVFGYAYTPIGYSPIAGADAGVTVTTEARVCWNGGCVDNAAGVSYTKGDRELVMLEGDGWVLPIRDGDHFVLKSAEIQADRPQ